MEGEPRGDRGRSGKRRKEWPGEEGRGVKERTGRKGERESFYIIINVYLYVTVSCKLWFNCK